MKHTGMVNQFILNNNCSSWKWWNFGRLKFNLIILLLLNLKITLSIVLHGKVFFPAAIVFDLFVLLFFNLIYAVGYYYELLMQFFNKNNFPIRNRKKLKLSILFIAICLYLAYTLGDLFFSRY